MEFQTLDWTPLTKPVVIEVKQKWDILLEYNKNYIILAFNCMLKNSMEMLLVSRTCVEDRNKNIKEG